VNRTDRLYAIVEELRAVAPRPRSAGCGGAGGGVRQLDGTPFLADAGTALRNLVTAMQAGDAAAAQELAERIHLLGQPDSASPPAPMPRLVADALQPRRVLRIGYADRAGATTVREIEPLGYVGSPAAHWYLMAWCRLRDGCARSGPTGSPA
jgi:predicted DNA-binding transcriptional regulator YafY